VAARELDEARGAREREGRLRRDLSDAREQCAGAALLMFEAQEAQEQLDAANLRGRNMEERVRELEHGRREAGARGARPDSPDASAEAAPSWAARQHTSIPEEQAGPGGERGARGGAPELVTVRLTDEDRALVEAVRGRGAAAGHGGAAAGHAQEEQREREAGSSPHAIKGRGKKGRRGRAEQSSAGGEMLGRNAVPSRAPAPVAKQPGAMPVNPRGAKRPKCPTCGKKHGGACRLDTWQSPI
jgi:hypothetical protein